MSRSGRTLYYLFAYLSCRPLKHPVHAVSDIGIIGYADGLILTATNSGALYYLDLRTQNTTEILPPGSADFADGLAIGSDEDGGTILYIAENRANRISGWSLEAWRTEEPGASIEIAPLGYIMSDYYDDPATCDVTGNSIYAVNARFAAVAFPNPGEGDLATFNETFDIVGTDRLNFVLRNDEMSPLEDSLDEIIDTGLTEEDLDETILVASSNDEDGDTEDSSNDAGSKNYQPELGGKGYEPGAFASGAPPSFTMPVLNALLGMAALLSIVT